MSLKKKVGARHLEPPTHLNRKKGVTGQADRSTCRGSPFYDHTPIHSTGRSIKTGNSCVDTRPRCCCLLLALHRLEQFMAGRLGQGAEGMVPEGEGDTEAYEVTCAVVSKVVLAARGKKICTGCLARAAAAKKGRPMDFLLCLTGVTAPCRSPGSPRRCGNRTNRRSHRSYR